MGPISLGMSDVILVVVLVGSITHCIDRAPTFHCFYPNPFKPTPTFPTAGTFFFRFQTPLLEPPVETLVMTTTTTTAAAAMMGRPVAVEDKSEEMRVALCGLTVQDDAKVRIRSIIARVVAGLVGLVEV